MLYMKTRVTFRVAPGLADALRELPNQTQFVESALREALRSKCPACGGSGRREPSALYVSNFRRAALPALTRESALQLKGLVGLARRVAATSVELRTLPDGRDLDFVVARGNEILLAGTLNDARASLRPN
jgi:hypothetical protein